MLVSLEERRIALMTLPRSAGEFFLRAMSRHRQGDLAGALADFEEAARLDPASAELRNNCGALRRALGDLDGALAAFEEALRCNPRSAEAFNNRGVIRLMRGDPTRALADFDEAVRLSPSYVNALSNRGVARRELGDLAGAMVDFNQVLRVDPSNLDAARNRALARREAGDLAGAAADLDQALARFPRAAAAGLYLDRANVRIQQGDWLAAVSDLDQALAIDPRLTEAYIYRGNARHHDGDPMAIVDHLRAFRLDGPMAARELVELVRRDMLRDPEAVFQVCNKHLMRVPDDPVALIRRGLSFMLLGRTEEAITDLDRAAGQSPELRSSRELLERAVKEYQAHLTKEGNVSDESLPWLKKLGIHTRPRARTDADGNPPGAV
jgi:tetratricopeptide (TPR) repeat protein